MGNDLFQSYLPTPSSPCEGVLEREKFEAWSVRREKKTVFFPPE